MPIKADAIDSPDQVGPVTHVSARSALLARFFAPRSLAIVGASEEAYWSRNAQNNLDVIGFAGAMFPVNPKRPSVFGVVCTPSLRQIGALVDLAYIAAPTGAIPGILDDAGAAGIRNAVVIAGGFAESGEAGHRLQQELAERADRHEITLLGPNCPGFLNVTDRFAAYGQQIPPGLSAGAVGIVLQSGALTTVLLKFSIAHAIGLSKVICLGNEADIQAADVLEYLIDDPHTQVVAMFLEQIRDGSRFRALAERALHRGKAIVVLKAGRTPAGQLAALAHTGAVAGDEAVIDAALRQSGVIRVRSLEEMLITAGFLAQGYELGSGRMAVVTASGGACDIIADRASDEGLDMPVFAAATRGELQAYLPAFATVQNPLDTAAVDTVRQTGTAAVPMDVVAEIVTRDPEIDFVLYMGFNVVPQTEPKPIEREAAIARMAHVREMRRNATIPLIPIGLTSLESGPFARLIYAEHGLWLLPGIEFGLTAVGHAVRWNRARLRAASRMLAASPAPAIPAGAGREGPWSEAEGRRLLKAAGVPLVPATLALSAEEAVAAADAAGYPAVVKICAADIAHKSDIGGVRLNLQSAAEVRAAYEAVHAAGLKASRTGVEGVLVSPMRPRGIELFAGVTVDPTFGPVLAVGLGGIWIETLKDVSLALLPVDPATIEAMLRSLRARSLLEGARGGPKVNLAVAAEAIWRCSQAAHSLGARLRALEVNPFWCLDDRVEALDALVVTAASPG
jgi:acyl-CoA synthetase (NDP forming)